MEAETHVWKVVESVACLVRAGRDIGKLGRLVLISIPRWCDVGVVNRYGRGFGGACSSCRGPRRRGVIEVSSGVQWERKRFQAERCSG